MDRLISEQAVLDVINKAIRVGRFYYGKNQTIEEIKAIPSAEPKTGHWIDIYGGVECDKCGKWYPHAPIAKNEIKFCSECGAKMIEPQERSGEE